MGTALPEVSVSETSSSASGALLLPLVDCGLEGVLEDWPGEGVAQWWCKRDGASVKLLEQGTCMLDIQSSEPFRAATSELRACSCSMMHCGT
jgi:hypothetical protein